MSAITESEKNRALKQLRHWYSSHKNSIAHYEQEGNEKAVDYHNKQLNNLVWFANLINRLDTIPDVNLNSDDVPF